MSTLQQSPYTDLFDAVLENWKARLQQRGWVDKERLIKETPAELCDAYLRKTNPSAFTTLVVPHAVAWYEFEHQVLPRLIIDRHYEEMFLDGEWRIRYRPERSASPPDNEPSKNVEPTTEDSRMSPWCKDFLRHIDMWGRHFGDVDYDKIIEELEELIDILRERQADQEASWEECDEEEDVDFDEMIEEEE